MYDDIAEGEILWITPDVHVLRELPNGFALRVEQLFGKDYDRPDQQRVFVGGLVLLNTYGASLSDLIVSVPVDQPRAVSRPPSAHRSAPPPSAPTRTVGTARPVIGAHRTDEPAIIEHAGRLYRRKEFR